MAGGKGTRLKSLTENKHKSLIEISGKPIIIYLIEHLISFGIQKIYISVGHLSNQIIDFLGDGGELGISIEYIHETVPMGSIGALTLKTNWEYDTFLVLNGDIFTNFDANDFISTFFKKKVDMSVLTFQNDIDIPWGVLNINSKGEITKLVEKPKYTIPINAGIYLFNRYILNLLPSSSPMEGWELMQLALSRKHKIIGIPLDGYWIDIGTTETLLKAQAMLVSGTKIGNNHSTDVSLR
jgi:NDP-sugar pyrophosphorylase family protein